MSSNNRKSWSDKEVTKLIDYVEKFGRNEGLTKFSEETGRSVDSVRRKLLRVTDTNTTQKTEYVEPSVNVDTVRSTRLSEIAENSKIIQKIEGEQKRVKVELTIDDIDEKDFAPVTDPRFSSDEETKPTFWKRLYNWIFLR